MRDELPSRPGRFHLRALRSVLLVGGFTGRGEEDFQYLDEHLGAYLRRQKARLGAPKAVTATAHKLARLVYMMLKQGTAYVWCRSGILRKTVSRSGFTKPETKSTRIGVRGEFRLAGNHNPNAGFSFSYPYGQNQAGTTGCDTFSTVTFSLTHQTPYPYIQNI